MSTSWGAYPPPRNHSRSRSPGHRGSQHDYPQPAAGAAGWDDRGYDRREPRGRSRSPTYDDGRKRRRSPSPSWDRGGDRYEPRPRYQEDFDAHSRSRAYSPNRRFGPSNGGGRGRQLPDPYQMDSPATFKQFAEWFRHTFPRETSEDDIADKIAADNNETKPKGMRTRYERYKKEFHCRQVQTLYDYHRKAPWFQERYDPAPIFENLRKRIRKRGWQGRLQQFLSDLEDGKFDPDTSPALDAPKSAGDAPPADASAEENKASSPPKEGETKQEDEQMFDDDAGDNEDGRGREPMRQSTGSDEISIPPEGNEVMIRTIAPDIGRLKLEESLKTVSGFMYLALGEPMQKRNYYRAGWIRFEDGTDMEKVVAELSERKIDGFKLHVSHTTRPFITRIKNTPEIASRPDRIRIDYDNAKLLAAKLEAEARELRHWKEPSTATNGETTDGAKNGEDVQMSDASANGNGVTADDDPEPAESGIDAVERRIAKLWEELPKPDTEDSAAEEAFETQKLAVALDLYVAYLRAAFNTCFYCAAVVDHIEELHRKCAGHRRKAYVPKPTAADPTSSPLKTDVPLDDVDREREKERDPTAKDNREGGRGWVDRSDEQFVEKLDARMALTLRPDKVDPKDHGGKNIDEELSKAVEPHMKQEDEGKFRCKTCSKLFKATSFIEKHIANKHSELVKGLDDVTLFNRFALDPQRIQPYTRVPAPSGSSQPLAPQAFGLQAPVHPMPDFNRRGDSYRPQYSPNMGRGGDRMFAGRGPPQGGFDGGRQMGGGFNNGGGMQGGRPRRDSDRAGPPPPPPDAKEDPRATAGRKISYHDMDEVAEGDVELTY
ncbi:hypothetical protein BKA62DRAFT_616893 [Auriculariales sp. MPI-PUGE-AT-0066]|nr:hypothetical protein BKA62DRAFT_616893 [Auriculariales sp. MPI-PUGE-AT-0066]